MKTHTHKMRSTITKADESAEEVMKCYTGKYTARRVLFIIPILAILFTVSPIPAQAGVIDTVNNKVTTILNKVKSIASNTSGLQEFITTLRDIRDSMGGGMISDMRETLGETQDLLQFIKDRRQSAGQTSQYPSLHVLVESLGGISDVLTDRDGQGGAFEGLSALLAVLPDKAIAPVARTISRVGVDGNFVAKINQMAIDLVDLREILKEIDARRDAAVEALYIAEFGCHVHDPLELVKLSRDARAVKTIANLLKLYGAILEAKGSAIDLKTGAGVWGWLSVEVDTNHQSAIGKLLVISGDGALNLVARAEKHVDKCKDKFYNDEA